MTDTAWAILAIAGVLVLAAGAFTGFFANRAHQRRRAAVREWADENGWNYTEHSETLLHDLEDCLRDSRDAATDVIDGVSHGKPALSFAYRWQRSNGENRGATHMHMIGLQLPARVPQMKILPGGAMLRAAAAETRTDSRSTDEDVARKRRSDTWETVEADSEQFNQKWFVTTNDPAYAREFLNPGLVDRLARDDVPRCTVWVGGEHMFLGLPGNVKVTQIEPSLRLLHDLAALMPEPHGPRR